MDKGITKPEEHCIPTQRTAAAPRKPSRTSSRPALARRSRESLPPSASLREHQFPSNISTKGGLLPAGFLPHSGAGRNFYPQERVCTVECCRPASKGLACHPLPFTLVAAERSGADPTEKRGYRACWVYGRSASRSAGWCFSIRASCVPWQGTFGRAPISK